MLLYQSRSMDFCDSKAPSGQQQKEMQEDTTQALPDPKQVPFEVSFVWSSTKLVQLLHQLIRDIFQVVVIV